MSDPLRFERDAHDGSAWLCKDIALGNGQYFDLSVETNGSPPRLTTIGRIFDVLAGYPRLWSQAVELFLEDPELGEALRRKAAVVLPGDDLAAALIKALSLEIAFFVEGDLADFELCFRLPWDPAHSYDVEYEEAQAQRFTLSG